MGELVDQCTKSQKIAGLLSIILSIITTILAFVWASHDNDHYTGWLGGFNKCTIHAVVMILGMCFCYTQALMSFRVLHFLGHDLTKRIHAMFHTLTIGAIITGLYNIIKWHNFKHYGHLSTMHSWLGILLILVYFQNWVLGIICFGIQRLGIPIEWKKKYLPSHRFLGIVGLLLATIVMQTGIAQKNWVDGTNGCMYTFSNDSEQNNPASAYTKIGMGCRMGMGIGILIILNCIAALYALWQFPVEIPQTTYVKPTEKLPEIDELLPVQEIL